ncbi:hypothetical protein, partial [Anabaena sp. AL09]|uniref:hypothetical protein n=1 Tax=Anabaena sp. AL09 TaxID=1710891 RepID=UPI0007FD5145
MTTLAEIMAVLIVVLISFQRMIKTIQATNKLTLPALKRRGFFVQRYDLLAQDFSSTSRGL